MLISSTLLVLLSIIYLIETKTPQNLEIMGIEPNAGPSYGKIGI
jgi:hypothetical protein